MIKRPIQSIFDRIGLLIMEWGRVVAAAISGLGRTEAPRRELTEAEVRALVAAEAAALSRYVRE